MKNSLVCKSILFCLTVVIIPAVIISTPHQVAFCASSKNYQLLEDVSGGGGGEMSSPNYKAVTSYGHRVSGDGMKSLKFSSSAGFIDAALQSPQDQIREIIDNLKNINSKEVKEEINQAIGELNKPIGKFDQNKVDSALGEISIGVNYLIKAYAKGVDTQSEFKKLVCLTQGLTEQALDQAIKANGENNHHITKAKGYYEQALAMAEAGKFDMAIKEFKKAHREAKTACGEWVSESLADMLKERITEVHNLLLPNALTNGTSQKATGQHLKNAENRLKEALKEAINNNLAKALDRTWTAIHDLEKAVEGGAEAAVIIDSLLVNVEDAVYQKIIEAEALAGQENKDQENKNISEAWEEFDLAGDKTERGDYDKSMTLFKNVALRGNYSGTKAQSVKGTEK